MIVDAEKLWEKWSSCHDPPGQSDRVLRGKDARYTPILLTEKIILPKCKGMITCMMSVC